MKRKLLALSGIVFAAHSITLYAYAAEAAWLNSPSVLSVNEDIQVSGGGAFGGAPNQQRTAEGGEADQAE